LLCIRDMNTDQQAGKGDKKAMKPHTLD
jgi:hypothetical protein